MKRHRDLLAVLRANGMRITAGRRVLLQFILDSQSRRVSLREIHQHVDDRMRRIDRSSVYRNLIAFERLGIIQALNLSKSGKTYQYILDRHIHHFYICKACGNARRGNRKLFERIEAALRETHGFAKANLSVVFYGTCASCSTTGNRSGRTRSA
ncbi:MAG TPA: Fur family transcriptional regulator [Polyangia bacterium]|nr:Fur family transcriptional regulator [Polyangia bacterium]